MIVKFSLITVGVVSVLSQIILLRELAVAFYGIEFVYIIGIGIWMLGTGLGSGFGSWAAQPSLRRIALLFLLFVLFLSADIFLIRAFQLVWRGVPGSYLSLHKQILSIAVALLPIGAVLGILFAWAARARIQEGGNPVTAYLLESLGCAAGGLLSLIFPAADLSVFESSVLCSVIALLLLARFPESLYRFVTLIGIAVFLALWFSADRIDFFTTRWNHPHLIHVEDTAYGRVAITSYYQQLSVYVNGIPVCETDGVAVEELVHFALLSVALPQRVLLVGGGWDGSLREILKHPVAHVDYLEMDREMIATMQAVLPPGYGSAVSDPRVRVLYGDPRREVGKLGSYDAILMNLPQPLSIAINRFYTFEFYQKIRRHLTENGVLAFRFRSSDNFWADATVRRNLGIMNALKAAFPYQMVMVPGGFIVLVSSSRLPEGISELEQRLYERNLKTHLVSPEYIRYAGESRQRLRGFNLLRDNSGLLNTDEKPIGYYYAQAEWFSKFTSIIAPRRPERPDDKIHRYVLFGIITLAGFIAFLSSTCLKRSTRILIWLAFGGFAGMILETVLFLRFQSMMGVLYQDIGLLLTLFMIGLTCGSAYRSLVEYRIAFSKNIPMFVLLGLGIWTATRIHAGGMAGMAEIGFVLLVCGWCMGAVFAAAVSLSQSHATTDIGRLYSADVFGGCLATLIAWLILIPLSGMIWTSILAAAVSLIGIMAIRAVK